MTARNAAFERARLIDLAREGRFEAPKWDSPKTFDSKAAMATLAEARSLLSHAPSPLYRERLQELEVHIELLSSPAGEPRRRLAARLFGDGTEEVEFEGETRRAIDFAHTWLEQLDPAEPAPPMTAQAFARQVRALAERVGVVVRVTADPRLAAHAATGGGDVYIRGVPVDSHVAVRTAAHEVLAHVVCNANARVHPLGILRVGTANSFADHEGFAIELEWQLGLLDVERRRTLAARCVAVQQVHQGAAFVEVLQSLVKDRGFRNAEAFAITERAFRGGGLPRDAAYITGWLRVHHAVATGRCKLNELWLGRVSLDSLEEIRRLRRLRLLQPPVYRPDLESIGNLLRGKARSVS